VTPSRAKERKQPRRNVKIKEALELSLLEIYRKTKTYLKLCLFPELIQKSYFILYKISPLNQKMNYLVEAKKLIFEDMGKEVDDSETCYRSSL
jgi:hypothetical protein